MRRIAAALAVIVGITLIAFTFGEHLFSRSRAAQKISDHYQPLMSEAGLDDLANGFDAVKAAGAQLDTEAEPRLARALGLDAAEWKAYKEREMPGIAAFDAQAPGVVALVGPVIGDMQTERQDYARASAIPTSWLPLSSAPWLFLGIGALLVAVGALTLVRPGRAATSLLLVAGLGIVVAPLVVGIPGKVDAAIRVTKLGRVGLAPATGQKAVGATQLFDGMVSDVRTKLQPALVRVPRRSTSARRSRRSPGSRSTGSGRPRPSRTRSATARSPSPRRSPTPTGSRCDRSRGCSSHPERCSRCSRAPPWFPSVAPPSKTP